jgi:osmotically-inducible protein OsmY
MDERDRQMRERDWRRSEQYGRGGSYGSGEDYRRSREDYAGGYDFEMRGGEGRSFGSGDDEFAARLEGPDRDRVFGERETGENYTRGTGMSSGGAYGGGESYGRGGGGGGRPQGYQGRIVSGGGQERGGRGGGWQERGYQGTSPAFRNQDQGAVHGRAWQDRDYGGTSPAFRGQEQGRGQGRSGGQDYSQGGRFYGDDDRQPIYREEYGMGGREYGPVPGGYDARREGWGSGDQYGGGQYGGQSGGGQSYGGGYGGGQPGSGAYGGGQDYRDYRQGNMRPAYGDVASGGTGGYDFERGYGDGGRGDMGRGGQGGRDVGDRAQDFLSRAGQKISNFFRGDHLMEGSRPDEQRGYREDFGREYRADDRGHRGRGPKGYKRSDERISDEVHERLADDSWLDASNIDVKVENGEVTLSGTVENRQAKHRAERLVEDISGVDHVQNNLRVVSNPITGSGTGFGDSATETLMGREGPATGGATTSTTGGGTTGEDSASTRTTTRRT